MTWFTNARMPNDGIAGLRVPAGLIDPRSVPIVGTAPHLYHPLAYYPAIVLCPYRESPRPTCYGPRRAGSSVVEQGTFNPLVVGSNPTRLTTQGFDGARSGTSERARRWNVTP